MLPLELRTSTNDTVNTTDCVSKRNTEALKKNIWGTPECIYYTFIAQIRLHKALDFFKTSEGQMMGKIWSSYVTMGINNTIAV